MKISESKNSQDAIGSLRESPDSKEKEESHFQELLALALHDSKKEEPLHRKKERNIIFFLSLFLLLTILFQTICFFILYREIKTLQRPSANSLVVPNAKDKKLLNPPFPQQEIIEPLVTSKRFSGAT